MPEQPNRDEWISAYLDGALDSAAMAEFEAAMDDDPALAAEVERLLGNDSFLRAAFDDPIQQGVDDALLGAAGFALAATVPPSVVLSLAGLAGLISSETLAKGRRYAVVAIVFVAAIVTPPEPMVRTLPAVALI